MGMKFKNSDRIHQVGKKKGQPMLIPDIKVRVIFQKDKKFLMIAIYF